MKCMTVSPHLPLSSKAEGSGLKPQSKSSCPSKGDLQSDAPLVKGHCAVQAPRMERNLSRPSAKSTRRLSRFRKLISMTAWLCFSGASDLSVVLESGSQSDDIGEKEHHASRYAGNENAVLEYYSLCPPVSVARASSQGRSLELDDLREGQRQNGRARTASA